VPEIVAAEAFAQQGRREVTGYLFSSKRVALRPQVPGKNFWDFQTLGLLG